MPVYNFLRVSDGESVEMRLSFDEFDAAKQTDGTFAIDGERYTWDLPAFRAARSRLRDTPGAWPQYSASLGCLPHEIPEFVAESRKIGIPTEFTKDGQAIFTDPEHKRKYAQAHHVIDRSGFNW